VSVIELLAGRFSTNTLSVHSERARQRRYRHPTTSIWYPGSFHVVQPQPIDPCIVSQTTSLQHLFCERRRALIAVLSHTTGQKVIQAQLPQAATTIRESCFILSSWRKSRRRRNRVVGVMHCAVLRDAHSASMMMYSRKLPSSPNLSSGPPMPPFTLCKTVESQVKTSRNGYPPSVRFALFYTTA
jgi:hypothetical protein